MLRDKLGTTSMLIGLLFRPESRVGWMASGVLVATMWLTVLGTSIEGGIEITAIPAAMLRSTEGGDAGAREPRSLPPAGH